MNASKKVDVQASAASSEPSERFGAGVTELPSRWKRLASGSSRVACERLAASLENLRVEVALRVADQPDLRDSAWDKATTKQLDNVAVFFRRGQIDAAWRCLNVVATLLILVEDPSELRARATALRHEAASGKLSSWRSKAVDEVIANAPHDAAAIDDLRARLVAATRLRDDAANNLYYKVALVRSQRALVMVLLGGLLALIVGVTALGDWDSRVQDPSVELVVLVALLGALGGCLSAIQKLGHPRGPIPDYVAASAITLARPAIGAAAALGIYTIAASGALNIDFSDTGAHLTLLALAFAAGFSERFVIAAVGAATGAKDEDAKPAKT